MPLNSYIPTLIHGLLTLALMAMPCVSRGQKPSEPTCSIREESRAAQYISYERASKSDVYLRLHNNSTCSITIETDDQAPLRSGPGRFVALHYLWLDRWRETTRVAYGWGDSVFTVDLPPGDSVTFAVPLAKIRKRLDVAVPFIFGWEGGHVGAGAVGGVKHHVHFLWEDVPKPTVAK